MAFWMDLTNSMVTWQGGTVGIIRVELETAKTMKLMQPELRFSAFKDGSFHDITDDISWLWESENACQAYLEKMNRVKPKTLDSKDNTAAEKMELTPLEEALEFSPVRQDRLREATKLWISCIPKAFRSIVWNVGRGIYKPLYSVYSPYMTRRAERRAQVAQIQAQSNPEPGKPDIMDHPYKDGDCVFCCGWYTSGKEEYYSRIKNKLKHFHISYMVYDLVLIKPETACFYNEYWDFVNYLHWISANCDHVFFWGQTAQDDFEKFSIEMGWRVPEGSPVFYGSVMQVKDKPANAKEALRKLGIKGKYVMMVGSVEPKKNYDVIYKAYHIMAGRMPREVIPQCVIIGSNFGSCKELVNDIKNDPLVKDKFLFLRATDEELDLIYRNASFTMVPSFYEGWSIVVAEMLSYGKLCIAADVAPLREVAGDLAVYADPLDPVQWADTIARMTNNPEEVRGYEREIKSKWKSPTWKDGAQKIFEGMRSMARIPDIYYDFQLGYGYSFMDKPALTGIPRSVLLMAKNLFHYLPNLKFFAITDNGYISFDYEDIRNICEGKQLDSDFIRDSEKIRNKKILIPRKDKPDTGQKKDSEKKEIGYTREERMQRAKWLFASVCKGKLQKHAVKRLGDTPYPTIENKRNIEKKELTVQYECEYTVDVPFREGDVVLTLGPGLQEWVNISLNEEKKKKKFLLIETIYDMTPVILPQTHNKETLRAFCYQLLPHVFVNSDYIIYGGKTAMRDAEAYARKAKYPVPKAIPVKWGNDFNNQEYTKERKKVIFQYYGIRKPFILTVGTVQRRKNQEVLYHAFLHLIEENKVEDLQLIIAGYPGWGYSDFIKHLQNDKRCEGRIIMLTPSDEELNVLYQNCLFTVLPSMYEGWSLTLPESLGYGKFCIASNSDPLVEIGGDLIDYVEPFDMIGWADKIEFYATHPDELEAKEKQIQEKWQGTTWDQCAEKLAEKIGEITSHPMKKIDRKKILDEKKQREEKKENLLKGKKRKKHSNCSAPHQ